MQSPTAAASGNRCNRADITIAERDGEIQNRVNAARNQQQTENSERADVMKEIALPTHTLFKDEIKGGFVFFKKEDLKRGMIISL